MLVALLAFFSLLLSPSDFPERERCWPEPNAPFQERKYHYTGIMNERDPSVVFKAKHEPLVHLGSVLSHATGFLSSLSYLLRVSVPQLLSLQNQSCSTFPTP